MLGEKAFPALISRLLDSMEVGGAVTRPQFPPKGAGDMKADWEK